MKQHEVIVCSWLGPWRTVSMHRWRWTARHAARRRRRRGEIVQILYGEW